uniref:Pyrrolo-quinoline quinone repeat domain-containing protein n=1 Tax=Tetradesmus obliquus TaxID=3088 RepID=A0A383V615_TETOB
MKGLNRSEVFAIILSVTLDIAFAAGYPSTWTSSHLDAGYPAGVTCISHPATDWGEHGSPSAVAITFTLAESAGKAVNAICPGATYTITEKLAGTDSGHIFVTTTAGSLSPGEKPAGWAITFTLADSAGKAVNAICPGATYTITEKLAGTDSGHIFVTTTAGSLSPGEKPAGCNGARFGSANRAPSFSQKLTEKLAGTDSGHIFVTTTAGSLSPGEKPAGCNGARFGSANRAPSFSQKLTVSCKEVTATDKVTLAVTYTTGTGGNFRRGSATFNIDPSCYTTICGGSTLSPSPSPSPKPSPSPTPSSCSVLPNVTGITWPALCSGKLTCQAACRTGFAGGRVRASCGLARGWTVTGFCTCVSRGCGSNPSWGHWGGDLQNTRNAASEKGISPANVGRLARAWVFNTTADVSATPTVVGNRLLVPDWGGYMYCLNADTVTATDKVTLAVTYTTGTGGNFRQGSATFNIDPSCYTTTCGGSTLSPSPSPSPKPSSLLPGTSPSPKPSPSPTPSSCSVLPNVTGITWPALCSGKLTCQAACRTGFAGGRVRASCGLARGWTVTGFCTCVSRRCGSNPSWGHWGGDLQNTRIAASEKGISPANVGRLARAWVFNTTADVSATPTVVGNRLLVPDWGGYMYCLNADTGALIWSRPIIEYVLAVDPAPYPPSYSNASIISRTSPAVAGDVMVFGVMKKGGGFPYLIAANVTNGVLLWGFRADPHPAAMITQSPTVHNGAVYVGVSSLEELIADNPEYECCTFIGNMLKVDLATGTVVWRTYMAPQNNNQTGGFSGNSVWGSSPALNLQLGHVYIATGNNYEIPKVLAQCHQAVGNLTVENMQQHLACEAKYGQGNYHNCMIALDMETGAIRWAKQLGGPDAWNAACLYSNNKEACPDLNSPDYDFAQAPMLVKTCKTGACKQLVVAGQKSGWVWALRPRDGSVDWSLQVGPGGLVGGMQWGSAADSQRIYVSNNNANGVSVDLTQMKAVPNTPGAAAPPASTKGGLAAAVDAFSGKLLWTFANPTMHWDTSVPPQNARSQAPMTVANGVVYYASMDAAGSLFYLEAATGRLLGNFSTGATLGCGPSVARGKVYTGSGYLNFGLGQRGNKLHALRVA